MSSSGKTTHHHSSGGLVFFEDRILLISTQGGRRWQLPKGHIEAGESAAQAAFREIREETGVSCQILDRLGQLRYEYRGRSGGPVHKRVEYFMCSYLSGSVADFDPVEVSAAVWLPWRQGIERLTFDNERELVERAFSLWKKREARATATATYREA